MPPVLVGRDEQRTGRPFPFSAETQGMNQLTRLIDRYVLFARVAPVAIVSSAMFLLISSWIPFSEWPIKLIAGSGMLVLGAFALAHLARKAGQAIQAPLWASWGGPPTVRMLRHRDPTFTPGS